MNNETKYQYFRSALPNFLVTSCRYACLFEVIYARVIWQAACMNFYVNNDGIRIY